MSRINRYPPYVPYISVIVWNVRKCGDADVVYNYPYCLWVCIFNSYCFQLRPDVISVIENQDLNMCIIHIVKEKQCFASFVLSKDHWAEFSERSATPKENKIILFKCCRLTSIYVHTHPAKTTRVQYFFVLWENMRLISPCDPGRNMYSLQQPNYVANIN